MKYGTHVKIIGGTYAGHEAIFQKHNDRRPGKCFVFFKTASANGAQVNLSDIVEA